MAAPIQLINNHANMVRPSVASGEFKRSRRPAPLAHYVGSGPSGPTCMTNPLQLLLDRKMAQAYTGWCKRCSTACSTRDRIVRETVLWIAYIKAFPTACCTHCLVRYPRSYVRLSQLGQSGKLRAGGASFARCFSQCAYRQLCKQHCELPIASFRASFCIVSAANAVIEKNADFGGFFVRRVCSRYDTERCSENCVRTVAMLFTELSVSTLRETTCKRCPTCPKLSRLAELRQPNITPRIPHQTVRAARRWKGLDVGYPKHRLAHDAIACAASG